MTDENITYEEIRARREALAEARAKRHAEAQAADDAKRELQALKDEEALETIEGKYGKSYVYGAEDAGTCKVAVVRTAYGSVIVKRAAPQVFKKFQSVGKTDEKTLTELVRPSLLHPTPEAFFTLCDTQPMVLMHSANAVCELAGAKTAEVGKG